MKIKGNSYEKHMNLFEKPKVINVVRAT